MYGTRRILLTMTAALPVLAACGPGEPPDAASGGQAATSLAVPVDSSGKVGAELADVPADVLETARQAMPGITIVEAEYETRDGREYYDVAGLLSDGREIELDMTRVDGAWTVVEIQRDITYADLPPSVSETLTAAVPDWEAARIIESDQGDGTVIYEFFGPEPANPVKHEVKLADGVAELLTEEWAH